MRPFVVFLGICALIPGGCHSFDPHACCPADKGPKTLLSWEIGPKEEEKNGAKNGDEDKAKSGSNGEDNSGAKANGKPEPAQSNGNGNGKNGNGSEPEPPDEITTDRPDFTEASSTVGRGRIQLETGYTYSRNKEAGITGAHSYPEVLLRIGMFADWFELRLGKNYSNTGFHTAHNGSSQENGFEDFYVGTKLFLTEQKSYLPETAIVFQATVPTARHALTAGRTLPGINYLFGWDDVIPEFMSLAGSVQANSAVDDDDHPYLELAESITLGYTLTSQLGAYTEFFGIHPHGATSTGLGAQYYFNGGFTYKLTPDVQFDIRAGVGLNRQSDDYFLGSGFAVRY